MYGYLVLGRAKGAKQADGLVADMMTKSTPAGRACIVVPPIEGGCPACPDLSSSSPTLFLHLLCCCIPSLPLKMAQPALALTLLEELGLAPAVYAPPEHLVPPLPEGGFDWPRGTAVARAAARLLAFRSKLSEVEGPNGEAEGTENEEETGSPLSGKAGTVELGTGGNSSSTPNCDETRKGAETREGGGEQAHATEVSKEGRGSVGSKGGSRNVMGEEVPATLLRELFLCAALLPLTGVKHKTKKGKLVSAAQFVVSDSLKVVAAVVRTLFLKAPISTRQSVRWVLFWTTILY